MKVLVVDDEILVRRALARAFQLAGHQVSEAAGGQEGLELWRTFLPDLVLLDVLMPDLNGPQVLEQIGTSKGLCRVILMSAYTGTYDLQRAKNLGADLFLSKPFEDIFSTVKLAEDLVGR